MTPLSRFLERKLPRWSVPWVLAFIYAALLISIVIGFRIDEVTIQYIQ